MTRALKISVPPFTAALVLFALMIGFPSARLRADPGEADRAVRWALEGSELKAQQAQALERQVQDNPHDIEARIKLLGYFFSNQFTKDRDVAAHRQHVLWIINNHPRHYIAGMPYAQLEEDSDPDGYAEAKRLWLGHVDDAPQDTTILANAASFLRRADRETAERLLRQAAEAEPQNPKWPKRLAEHLNLQAIGAEPETRKLLATAALEQYQKALSLTNDPVNRFYLLTNLPSTALTAGQIDLAAESAQDLLETAPRFRNDWNYGNAIHKAHIVLGHIALREEDLDKAKAHLLSAGHTPGSPQLNSFGPDFRLAGALLDRGEKQTVLEYLEIVSRFWDMGQKDLKEWSTTIRHGGRPDFGPFSRD